jgi:hypothetical protein
LAQGGLTFNRESSCRTFPPERQAPNRYLQAKNNYRPEKKIEK